MPPFPTAFTIFNLLIDIFTSFKVGRSFIDSIMGLSRWWLRTDWPTRLSLLSRSEKHSFQFLAISTVLVWSFVPSFHLRGVTGAFLGLMTCFMTLYTSFLFCPTYIYTDIRPSSVFYLTEMMSIEFCFFELSFQLLLGVRMHSRISLLIQRTTLMAWSFS